MAVKRAWVDTAGNVKIQLTDEQMSQFLNKVVNGLIGMATAKVFEELGQENRAAEAAKIVVANVW